MTTGAAIISLDHPDTVTYRRAADAFRAGDLDALATTIHEHGRQWRSNLKVVLDRRFARRG